MRTKLIAFDLDGTLLHDDKTVAARSLRALQAAHEAGALIVPATGRIYKVVPAALKLQPFSRYFITINGAYVFDAQEDVPLYRAEIGNELAIRLMEYMDTLDVLYDCYKDNWGFVSQYFLDHAGDYITDRGILEMFRRSRTPVDDLKEYLRADGGSIQKTQMHFRDLRERKRQLELLPSLFPEIAVSTSIPTNIELNIAAANKGDALRALCKALGVAPEETVAFGDGTNDLSMIRAAGLGVAMGNADFAVKAAADTVCDDNEHDGVAKFIERLLAET